MNSAIITGANGFIGKALINKLCKNNVKVYAIVRNKNNLNDFKKNNNVIIYESDMNNYEKLELDKVKDNDSVFYHFAWEGHSGNDRKNINLQLMNIKYCCEAIKLAKRLGCNKFVFPGSIIEFECINAEKENIKLDFNSIYGIAKNTSRRMGSVLAENIGIDFIQTTISNIYGAGEKSNRLCISTIKKLLKNENVDLTDGNQLYDFIYIDDAVEAYYLIGKYGEVNKNYYIGNKEQKALKKYLIQIKNIVNKNGILNFGLIPSNGMKLNFNEFDTNLLYIDFKFSPKVSFREGITKTKEWVQKSL